MSNILIVEAANDAIFTIALVNHLNAQNHNCAIKIEPNYTEINKGYITLESQDQDKKYRGLSKETLTIALGKIKSRLNNEIIQKVGIILDQDIESQENRLILINDSIKNVFKEAETIISTHQFVKLTTIEQQDVQIACYFMNIDGQGELETLLRTIKNHDSSIADCLENCLKQCLNPSDINQKNLDKKWIDHYLRYDTCSKKDKGDANNKCSFNQKGFDYVIKNKQNIWNFQHPSLEDLKNFLTLFNQ